jgi:hypothetical protein
VGTGGWQVMDISEYAAFFHDGSIMDILHIGDKIEFFMVSAEMDEDDLKDDIVLSKDDSIQGKLHVEGIKNIIVDKQPFLREITKKYDKGRVFDFEIEKSVIELSIIWVNFPPKLEVNEFSVIKIEAEKIWWENIPNLKSSY